MWKKRRGGYAMTFEVIFTLATIALMVNGTMYLMSLMDAQRYMHSVASSTATLVSRWGGTKSEAVKLNMGTDTSIVDNANKELRRVAPALNPRLTATPEIIKHGDRIEVRIEWQHPGMFGWGRFDSSVIIQLDRIMKPGRLLGG